jgi:metal-sulfur cluster biosynthetic enzyme
MNKKFMVGTNITLLTIHIVPPTPHYSHCTDLIKSISDPEHPLSLGELAVVSLPDISIKPTLPNVPDSPLQTVTVLITPTITHCSLATVIGLGVRVRLEQSLPPRFRVDVRIKEGTHSTGDEVNKQLGDKERVAAALENGALMQVIAKMMETCQ